MKKIFLAAALTLASLPALGSNATEVALLTKIIKNQELIIKNQEMKIQQLATIANSSFRSNSSRMKPYCKCEGSPQFVQKSLVRVQEIGGKLVEDILIAETSSCKSEMREHPACIN